MTDVVSVKLYDGEVTLEFHPRTHRYYVNGANPDGVTTVSSGIINKGEYLGNWIARTGVDHVRKGWLKAREEGELDPTSFLALCDEAETAHLRARDGAGDIGGTVHDLIEKYITGEPYEIPDIDGVKKAFKAFLSWKEQTNIEITQCERYVFSKKYFYAGRTDFVGRRHGNGSLVVGDFKTGSGYYDDMPYQLAGYACAIEEEMGYSIPEGLIIHLDKKTGQWEEYPVSLGPIDDNDPDSWSVKQAWRAGVVHYKNLKRIKKMVEAAKNVRGRKGS